ncbi:GIY-YIG nuclease family protein [Pseudoxanthomonas sacheonensis]|uniref:GIY-YIG nuclease family protein n=1 Tax=Pseudoxanthomonas sacheonensis TaxID=443615 RepID=UPI0013D38841|nr:GIY-YIG nuclease family protein [Pseudoxanthomonas sacheonensis]KAF1707474.1 hypothetical protein CSC73_12105 [Pseudoxanthomonas sacheonensis]
MLIHNFGHLWERKYIQFGRPGNKGHLKGYKTATGKEPDFREQIGIYILYDKDRQPVYIGQTGSGNQRLFSRLKAHTNNHLWNRWEYFTWFGIRRVNGGNNKLSEHDSATKRYVAAGSAILNEIEGVLISALEPGLNKQGPKWGAVDEYFQVVDEKLEERQVSEVLLELEAINKKFDALSRRLAKTKP